MFNPKANVKLFRRIVDYLIMIINIPFPLPGTSSDYVVMLHIKFEIEFSVCFAFKLKTCDFRFAGVDIMYGALKSLNVELLQTASEVRQFFDDDAERKLEILSRFLSQEKESQRASLSRKSDDPEWFKGNV